jgi:uncharacterized integral membrane protein (TIGR00698 family)
MDSTPRQSHPAVADLYGDLLETLPSQTRGWRSYWPGLVMTAVASLAAAYLSEHYGAPLMLMGLLIGLAFNFVNSDDRLQPGLAFASRTMLRWGIVTVGLQITIWQIADLGFETLVAIALIIAIVMATGAFVARIFRLGTAFGILAGGAVAICGASAALALSSVLGEKRSSQAQLTLVLVAISAASAFAMSTYPIIADLLSLDDRQAGFLIGASIHDVAQALGAGYSFSDTAGETAAIVKLTRVTLLAPTLAVVAYLYPSDQGAASGAQKLPWFVVGFLIVAAVNSAIVVPTLVTSGAKQLTSMLLLMAVTATGIRSPMHLLMAQGWRASLPVVVATVVAFIVSLAGALTLF